MLYGKIAALESRVEAQFNELRGQIGELRERMAHLEGLLEGLREALSGRVKAQLGWPLLCPRKILVYSWPIRA